MVQPHATAATPAEPTTRIEFASRRQSRGASSAADEGFAAILDRSTAQRIDALRQLRQGDEPIAEETSAPIAEVAVDPVARTRNLEGVETKTPQAQTQAKPQRRTGRGGDEPGEAAPAPAAAPSTKSESACACSVSENATPPAVDDTTTQLPVDAPTSTVVALVAQMVPTPPAPIQNATPVAPAGVGGPDQPGFVTPPATPSAPGTMPALPIAPAAPSGPDAPAEPMAQPMPAVPLDAAAPPVVPTAPNVPAVDPRTAAQPAALPTATTTQTPSTTPAPAAAQPAAPAKHETTKTDASTPSIGSAPLNAAPAPTNPAAAPATTPPLSDPASARGETAPAAALAVATLVESVQPVRTAPTRPEMLVAPGEGGATDDGLELPLIATGVRAPTGDEAVAATRGATARAAAGTSNAVAAQLAQHEDAIVAPTLPAAPTPTPTPIDIAKFGDEHAAEAKLAASRDDVAPVRHAIVVPPETSAARIENTSETVAARTARMPMHPAVAQVAVSVTKAVQEGVDRITIKLQPPELGRIDVRLEVGVDGRIQAVFAAERPATVEILQRDVRELERALQSAGLSTDAGSLSFGLKQNGGQNGNAFAAFERSLGTGSAGAEEEETALATTRSKRAAADGRLDIHV